MRARWLSRPEHRLDIVAGLCEGILTALILAAGRLISGDSVTMGLAVRVAAVAMLTDGFSFFVARYADLRSELIRAERQLNLTSPGRFATTRLGRAVLQDAWRAAIIVTVCSFFGALLPLIVSAVFPSPSWLGVAVAVGTLALLGVVLARSVYASPARWAFALTVAGIFLSLIGMKLEIM
jgi:VIT1/CCC1 family predicted Fe2+/Mn2+ transporter